MSGKGSTRDPANGCPGGGEPLIEMRQVFKTFHTPAGDFHALKGVDVCFYSGEFVAVVGRSGSGKSTLVNMITGIDHPTSGKVLIAGADIHRMSEGKISTWRGRNLGIVFQFYQLLPTLSLLENVLLPMDFAGVIPAAARLDRAHDLLDLVSLESCADLLPAEISGGQQQSAAIARALANDPPMIVADEPTGNLDSRTAAAVFAVFTRLAGEGKTIIMVTHDAGLAGRTQRVIYLSDGCLVAPETAEAAR
ncbi:MAG TPA: ABC transporter ATP-binding protein [Anaerolineaceae bacterium]